MRLQFIKLSNERKDGKSVTGQVEGPFSKGCECLRISRIERWSQWKSDERLGPRKEFMN